MPVGLISWRPLLQFQCNYLACAVTIEYEWLCAIPWLCWYESYKNTAINDYNGAMEGAIIPYSIFDCSLHTCSFVIP